ncbi:MAG: hypothetical protein J7513_07110 [Solirubrobacteraceae bacterium]|nr:hypothetical protein [Solirubrobacteraceae bacterium]
MRAAPPGARPTATPASKRASSRRPTTHATEHRGPPLAYAPPIYELPYTDLVAELATDAAPLPLGAGLGSTFVPRVFDADGALLPVGDPEDAPAPGRIALLVPGGDASIAGTLVVEHGEWSVACPLSSGQLHRLTNALDGKGTRPGIRPTSTTGATVHLGGSPELLTVDDGEHQVAIPAGPKRAMAKALRAAAPRD